MNAQEEWNEHLRNCSKCRLAAQGKKHWKKSSQIKKECCDLGSEIYTDFLVAQMSKNKQEQK